MYINLILKSSCMALIIIIAISSCTDKNNPVNNNPPCGGIVPLIVPEPPYYGPIWHPSGKFIGFNHTPLKRIDYPNECYGVQRFNRDSTGFWLINHDGTNMRRIFPYTLLAPSWSPDGQWIAFVVNAQIYKMRFTGTTFDTTTLVQLTTVGRNFLPSWSPDGQWIAYDNTDCGNAIEPPPPNSCGILMMKNDGTSKRFVARGRMPDWTTNGNFLIYVGLRSELYRVDLSDTSRVVRLTSFNQIDPYARNNRYPEYSPDGAKIAFWSSGNIWMMDSTGGNLRQLSTQGVDVDFGLPFSWSLDGSSIVYTDYRSNDWTYNNGILWILKPIMGEKKQLTFNQKPTE